MRGSSRSQSLLLVPLGAETILQHLQRIAASITKNAPIILAASERDSAYRESVQTASGNGRVVCGIREFNDALAGLELSDTLLVLDPLCLVKGADEVKSLVRQHAGDPRVSHHLVAFEAGVAGTKERVSLDAVGNVRSILRYYEAATWSFVAGVAATVLPVACVAGSEEALPHTLGEWRLRLAGRGVPSRDVPIADGAFSTGHEQGLLTAAEHFVRQTLGNLAGPVRFGDGHNIHAKARIVGPVLIHANARIDSNATVLGPTVIGAGAHVQSGAVVAHSVIGPASVVPAAAVVRDRIFVDASIPESRPAAASYQDRMARVAVEEPALPGAGMHANREFHLRLKRCLDIAVAGTGLFFMLPVIAVVSALIWLESRRPIFYGDEREGVGGEVFKCWKFRTMYVGAHAAQQQLKDLDHTDGPHFKVARDPRVSRVGRVLRALNLDEVPQLFNVLVGQMSLVGPRPSPFRENQLCVPWRQARLSVPPGITGMWQVCRHDRSAGDFHQWIEYDLLYVQHLSFWLDLKILVATVLTGAGKTHVRSSRLIGERAVERAVTPTADAAIASRQVLSA